ncbi:MAG TPA: alpha/beta fold hydrolase [Actinomycetota bacterium]|nr:alpha/beta fold hydrolase [Actinomycetota bacterium]
MERSLRRAEAKGQIVTEPQVLEGAEAFRIGSGPTGVLMIHGFTGSPQSLRALGEDLAARGCAVEGIRLPGHGTTWQDCNLATAEDWRRAVDEGFDVVADGRDEVFIVSLSFGSALAADLMARRADRRIKGWVSLAGFVHTDDPRRFVSPVVARLVGSVAGVSNDIADPDGREVAYDRLPTRASLQMLKVIKAARTALPKVTCPVLIMHGRNDHTVKPKNAEIILSNVSSEKKELVWLERSYHVITLDYDREEVRRRTHDFIREHSDVH